MLFVKRMKKVTPIQVSIFQNTHLELELTFLNNIANKLHF